MLEVTKKLATLLITLGFVSMSCAGAIGSEIQLLGGNPKVEAIKSTVGMSLADLDGELGTPNGIETCSLPFKSKGQEVMAQGKSFLWEHEFTDMPARAMRKSKISVCTMDGIVVSEHREGQEIRGNLAIGYDYYTFNFPLLQTIMENLLKDGKGKILPGNDNKDLEI
jgi:hypothetical protein